jgi:signal recognition particle receptor subunit beta
MATIDELRTSLGAVPTVLLDTEDQRVIGDALTTLDALEAIDVVPTTLAVVGSSGSGKSTITNALLAAEVSRVGVARPTTRIVTMAGGSGPVSVSVESEYVHVPGAPPGLLLIDTPPWEHDERAVRAAVTVADLVVLVITPSRYADARIADLVASIPSGRPAAVVVNRIDVDDADREELISSMRASFGDELILVDEGAGIREIASDLFERLDVDMTGYERAAVFRSAAAASARHVARTTASVTRELGNLQRRAESMVTPASMTAMLTVFEEWPPTRAELVAMVTRVVGDIDDAVTDHGAIGLAMRIRDRIGVWRPDRLLEELDAWRLRTVDRFSGQARVRWRRGAARQLLERFSWRVALNPEVPAPARFSRILGSRRNEAIDASRKDVDEVLHGAVDQRLTSWRSALDSLADYSPGELLVLADAFDVGRRRHG